MRKTLTLLCLLLAVHPAVAATGVPWLGSLRDASAQAQSGKKPLLLYLHADYCVWCKVMEQTTLQDSRVRLLAGQYAPCRLNGEREGKPAVRQYQVIEYPCFLVTDAHGALISKTTGMTSADDFTRVLSTSLPGASLARLEAECAAHPSGSQTIAVLTILRAERGEVSAAAHWQSLLPAVGTPGDVLAAADHALGLAYLAQGNDTDAVSRLRDAAAAATDSREVVALHLLAADCDLRLHRKADAVSELEAVRHLSQATKDEKNAAKKKEDHLPPDG